MESEPQCSSRKYRLTLISFSGADGFQFEQKTVGNIDRDENYVPFTRSHYNLPPQNRADYRDVFEETPIYTAGNMIIMQAL